MKNRTNERKQAQSKQFFIVIVRYIYIEREYIVDVTEISSSAKRESLIACISCKLKLILNTHPIQVSSLILNLELLLSSRPDPDPAPCNSFCSFQVDFLL